MRVLLLSLGKGTIDGKDVIDKNEYIKTQIETEGVYPYKTAKYRFKGQETIYESPFVAEALIEEFDPDTVVLIGTVQSCWAAFYTKFATGISSSNLLELYDFEATYGLRSCLEDREKIEEKISSIFSNTTFEFEKGVHRIIPVVIPYGIEDNATAETYRKISGVLERIIDCSDESIEVAFDITHSFRSMPIYNLVTVNYFSNLQNRSIALTHVYYGNLDVAGENDGVAEIIDLKDIVKILELTGGVSEFKNTGSTVTLCNSVDDSNLQKTLERFDLSMQLNAFNSIDKSISEILNYTGDSQETRVTDLEKMIKDAVRNTLLGEEVANNALWNNRDISDKQYSICKWFLEQKRYGLAVAVGMETLRSYLARIYQKKGSGKNLSEKEIEKEIYRKDVIERLKRQKFIDKHNDISEGLKGMADIMMDCKDIRDIFAHILSETSEKYRDKDLGYDEKKNVIEKIESFFDGLTWIKNQIENNLQEITEIYNAENSSKMESADNSRTSEHKRIVIFGNRGNDNYKRSVLENLRVGANHEYEVYYLDDRITEELEKDSGSVKKENRFRNAVLLHRILDNNRALGDERCHIVFVDMDWKQQYYYYSFLSSVIKNSLLHYASDALVKPIGQLPWDLTETVNQVMEMPLPSNLLELSEKPIIKYNQN